MTQKDQYQESGSSVNFSAGLYEDQLEMPGSETTLLSLGS